MDQPIATERRHLLLVAFYFPPARASGVFRARAIANHFVDAGWDVTVVTADEEFFVDVLRQADAGLLRSVDDAVRVVRAPFRGRRLRHDLRDHGWFRGNFPKVADRWLQRHEERRFPDPYAPWIPEAVRAGERVHAERPVDVILATGNPFSSFEVARVLAARTSAPYALDYRDSWTLDQFAEEPAYPEGARVWPAEQRVVEGAARIIFVNHAQEQWYADRYPDAADRMRVVENGFDAELLRADDVPSTLGDGLHLGYVGTLTRHLPWSELFAGWERVRTRPELVDARIDLFGHLGFFGHSRAALRGLLPIGDDDRVTYHGPLPKERVGAAYRDLDVLLLVTPNSRYITCQKVYEYMAAAKPIVSVNDPRTDARTPLAGYPLAFNVGTLTPDEVGRCLLDAAAAARAADPALIEEARAHARRFERGRRLEALEHEMLELARA